MLDIEISKLENKVPLLKTPDAIPMNSVSLKIKKEINMFNLEEDDDLNSYQVSFLKIFKFASSMDYLLMIVGTIGAICNGLLTPLYSIIFGQMLNELIPGTNSDLMSMAKQYSMLYLVVGAIGFFFSGLGLGSWMLTGERQNIAFRREYFRALIRQDITWFDSINPNQLTTKIANDTIAIQLAIGEKFSSFFYIITMFIAGYAIALSWNYELTLVLGITIFPMIASGGLFGWAIERGADEINKAYEKSGGFAEQALNSIRTVISLTGEEKEIKNYTSFLSHTKKTAIKWGIIMGASLGFLYFCWIAEYALGLWYGSKLITNDPDHIKTGDIMVVFLAVTSGSFTIGQLSPVIKSFSEAKKSLKRIIWLLERKPLINIENLNGKILNDNLKGEVIFNNVSFSYPSRESNKILNKINFKIEAGKKTALVGETGCGKSTCLQLLERFYDPLEGSITIDGINLKEIQLASLRNNIGYVGQEPVLFGTSIIENLRFGRPGASYEEIVEAAKKANALDFINNLENGFETFVGPGGTQLSGGQKQRIAIARAILKNPKILLLDEATSALDRVNEIEIQKTLDSVSYGITTIVIAHRLSTIINSDKIIVIENGNVIEEGTHEDLIEKKSVYYRIHDGKKIEKKLIIKEEKINDNELDLINNKSIDSIVNSENQDELSSFIHENEQNQSFLSKKYSDKSVFRRLFSIYDKEILLFYLLTVSTAIMNGSTIPILAIFYAEMLDLLNNPFSADFDSRLEFMIIIMMSLSTLSFFIRILGFCSSYVASGVLSLKLRNTLYKKMISLHIGWHDLPTNSPGSLATKLQSDIQLINGLTSGIMSILIETISALVFGIIISFVYSWKISISVIFTLPLMLICAKVEEELQTGFSKENEKAYMESSGLIMESVNNMRTVAAFGQDSKLISFYDKTLEEPKKKLSRKSIISGIIYGFSVFVSYAIYGFSYYMGILFLSREEVTFFAMFSCLLALEYGAYEAGSAMQYMPDVGKAKNAARSIYDILDTEIKIKNNEKNITKRNDEIKGKIEFKDVSFKYPTRDNQVFKNLNLIIEAGTKVALVGSSGCGKSTIVSLLLRFYDVDEGEILLDGINIKDYNVKFLRKCFGVVSQEPVLFDGTIEYNIKYNKEDATEEDVRNAAKNANALEFIEKDDFETGKILDKNYGSGFQRLVGPRGSQISGGQKQRIAIARAILNKPRIMLLDEATSALDFKNEKIVQESLDNIMKGKTSIAIAHRLSTIRDANVIYVFQDGKIIENGSFESLIKKKGVFFDLAEGEIKNKD